jgi:hypothetical protein
VGRPRLSERQPNFAGGLNLAADESQLGPNEIRRAENTLLTVYGGAVKRPGTKRLVSSAFESGADIQGGFTWFRAGAEEACVVVNGKLFTTTAAYTGTMTFTERTGALSTSQAPSFAAFRNASGEALYIADGGALNRYASSTLTTNIASTPSVSRVWVYNQRLFGISGDNEILYWSALNDGDTLGIAASGGGEAAVRTFGAQAIEIGFALGNSNVLVHRGGISVFTGWTQDDINIQAGTNGLSQDVGSIAARGVVVLETLALVPTERGIYRVTPDGVQAGSPKIDPVFAELSETDFQGIIGVHDRLRRAVWFFIPSVGVYAYHYRIDAWSGPFTGTYADPGITALWTGLDGSGQHVVVAGDPNGFVKSCTPTDVFVDDQSTSGSGGTPYTMSVMCRRFFAGDIASVKSLRWLYLLANLKGSTTATLTWTTDTDTGTHVIPNASTAWGSFLWGTGVWGTGGVQTYEIPGSKQGRFVDVVFSDVAQAAVQISSIEIEAFNMGRR